MKDVRDMVAKPRKIALYADMQLSDHYIVLEVSHTHYDEHYTPLPEGELRERPIQGYVRTSDIIEVQFAPVSNDEMVAKAVESLNHEEQKLRVELEKKLNHIREKRSQLLALTLQKDSV